MPRAPKQCARCNQLVTGSTYCPQHQPVGWYANPSANARTHTRAERQAFRSAVLAREPHCNCGAPATEADHIVPVSRGGSNNPTTNGQGLCARCHDRKTRTERRTK